MRSVLRDMIRRIARIYQSAICFRSSMRRLSISVCYGEALSSRTVRAGLFSRETYCRTSLALVSETVSYPDNNAETVRSERIAMSSLQPFAHVRYALSLYRNFRIAFQGIIHISECDMHRIHVYFDRVERIIIYFDSINVL